MVKIVLSKKVFYTLIAVFIVVLALVGVYALSSGVSPNPGHLIGEYAPPSSCSPTQFLKWTGSSWTCGLP